MANTVRNGANSSLGTSLTDAADDATLLVTSDGFFSTSSNAVQLTGLNSKATIGGLVESTGAGFAFTGGPGCYLTVLSTGTISGATAVKLSGNGNIANHGHILGAIGFRLRPFPTLENSGMISGAITGGRWNSNWPIRVKSWPPLPPWVAPTPFPIRAPWVASLPTITGSHGDTGFANEGTVRGDIKFPGAGHDGLNNNFDGIIRGSVTGGSGFENVANAGTITGNVNLGLYRFP